MHKVAEKKVEKKAEKKRRSIFTWFREMKSELKKVVWPTPKQVVKNTLIVLACVLIVGAFIWVFDYVAGTGITALYSLKG